MYTVDKSILKVYNESFGVDYNEGLGEFIENHMGATLASVAIVSIALIGGLSVGLTKVNQARVDDFIKGNSNEVEYTYNHIDYKLVYNDQAKKPVVISTKNIHTAKLASSITSDGKVVSTLMPATDTIITVAVPKGKYKSADELDTALKQMDADEVAKKIHDAE